MSDIGPVKTQKDFFREWLEKLQQESWQLELLISGLALFGIWESKEMLNDFKDYLDLNASGALTSYFNGFFNFLRIAWSIFFFNLLAHIVLRGLWIGAIGLRYVSGEIEYDKLDYADRFDKFLKKKVGDFDDYIQKLERISSVLFSFTFLLLFFFMSIMSMLLLVGAYMQFVSHYFEKDTGGILIACLLFFFFLGALVFIDFITFGAFKRIKDPTISRIYYWIYRVFGIITLSFLYRPLLYNFIDDKYTRRLVLFAIPYILILSILAPTLGFNAYNYMPSFETNQTYHEYVSAQSYSYLYYDDLREEYARNNYQPNRNPIIQKASLGSYEYGNEELGKIFIKAYKSDQDFMELRYPDLQAFSKKGFYSIFNSSDLKNETIAQYRTEEDSETSFMRRIIRGLEDRIDSTSMQKHKAKLEHYRKYNEEDYDFLKDSIYNVYSEKRISYYSKYLQDLLAANMDMVKLEIDEVDYKDSLDCSYFIHPNMGEKGILCYFPLSSLKSGRHTLEVSKKYIDDRKVEKVQLDEHFIPFIINRKTN